MYLLTCQEARRLDELSIHRYGIPSLRLMENAGRAASQRIQKKYASFKKGKIFIFSGPGNNGGDGLALARFLLKKGWDVFVFILSSPKDLKGDALTQFEKLASFKGRFGFFHSLESIAEKFPKKQKRVLAIDALFGIGLNRPLKGLYAGVIRWLNSLPIERVSLDAPSGLNDDTGDVLGEGFRAHETITFGCPKIGFFLGEASEFVGHLKVAEIGFSPQALHSLSPQHRLITVDEVKNCFATRKPSSHKGSFGHAFVIGGSLGKIGAGVMAALAALKGGAGLSTLVLPNSCYEKIDMNALEIMYEPVFDGELGFFGKEALNEVLARVEKASVVALGPGLGTHPSTVSFVKGFIQAFKGPLILDADGLNALGGNLSLLKSRKALTILTPHPGEMARLCSKPTSFIQKNRLQVTRELAMGYGVYVLLKGYRSLVGFPNGELWVNPTGNPTMASAGQGDILTGLYAAFLSQFPHSREAILFPPFLHGLTADLLAQEGYPAVMASDILKNLKNSYRFLKKKSFDFEALV